MHKTQFFLAALLFLPSLFGQTVELFVGNGTYDTTNSSPANVPIGSDLTNRSFNPTSIGVDQQGLVTLAEGGAIFRVTRDRRLHSIQTTFRGGFNLATTSPLGTVLGLSDFQRGSVTVAFSPQNNQVSAIVNTGSFPSQPVTSGNGDGLPFQNARFIEIAGAVADRKGNFFIYDEGANNIRVVRPNGIIETFLRDVTLARRGTVPPLSADSLGLIGLSSRGVLVRLTASGVQPYSTTPIDLGGSPYAIDGDDNVYFFRAGALVRRAPNGAESSIPFGTSSSWRPGILASQMFVPPLVDLLAADTQGFVYFGEHVRGRNVAASSTDFRVFRVRFPDGGRPDCTWSLSSLTSNLSAAAEQFTVQLNASSPLCAANMGTQQTWIRLPADTFPSGSQSLTFSVTANPAATARTGTVRIAGLTLTVNQAGTAPPPGSGGGSDLPPVITGIQHAATGQDRFSIGVFISIFGRNLSNLTATWDNAVTGNQLPRELGGVRVLFGNRNLPDNLRDAGFISYVSPTQINVLVPRAPGGYRASNDISVVRGTLRADSSSFYQSVAPGWFTYPALGRNYIAGFLANSTTLIAPVGALSGAASAPARPGDVVTLYLTGCDTLITDAVPVGSVLERQFPVFTGPASTITLSVGSLPARIEYLAHAFAGVCQLNATIPENVPPGPQPLRFSVLGFATQPNAVIEIAAPQ